MRVLIAPDCYGDSLTAVEAAEAIARGWRSGRPDDELVLAPQSDGGPGFVGVLAGRIGEVNTLRVSGPLTEDVSADWVLDPAAPRTAYIECAQACGLALLGGPPTAQTALAAHSRGVGQLMAAAVRAGAVRIVVGLGGSSCTDGGRGMIDELAAHARSRDKASLIAARKLLAGVELIAATDVEHPLLGPMGAAAVFGPQKGADGAAVAELERRLERLADRYRDARGVDVRNLPGSGAAGGLAGGLAAYGARLVPGAALVADVVGLSDALQGASLVLTGEGRVDATSFAGKVVGHVLREGRGLDVPVAIVAGDAERATLPKNVECLTLIELGGSLEAALGDAGGLAADAAAALARTV